ncbi:RHS repeat domain-containing protein [Nonlabens sp. Asnod3-A02]|uniref:RHS repeat domain-containing protein n=1 Tax=Nonlabens sp. Asnod3-A02 TaxID=3160579 RepID=UPI00386BBBEB
MVNLLKETSFNNFVYKKYEGTTIEEQKKRYERLDQGKDEKEIEKRAPVDVPIYFYHPDHLGTTNALTDVNGNMYQFFLNLPFGETMAEQTSISYYQTEFKFNGKELDSETGMYYYGARYYDPSLSIWMSVDPLAEQMRRHSPYNYAFNNPLRFTDPDGRAPNDIIITGNAAAIEKYKNTVLAATGGHYSVSLDSNGKVSLTDTGISNLGLEMTAEQKAFHKDYSAVVNSSDVINQEVVENDVNTVVDSWVTGKIDIADVAEFDKDKGAASSAGALIHSTVEQHEKSKLGLSSGDIGATTTDASGNTVYTDYMSSHKTGISAENRANGNFRGVGGNEDIFLESNGTKTQQTLTTTPAGGININKTKII